MHTLMLNEKIDNNTIVFDILLHGDNQITTFNINGIDTESIKIYPINFPTNSYRVYIVLKSIENSSFFVVFGLDDTDSIRIGLKIEDDKVCYLNYMYSDILDIPVKDEQLEERKKIAVEFLMSDEGFIQELMDTVENPEEKMDEGEKLCFQVAENTVYMHDEDAARSYINYYVVVSENSVQNELLNS